LEKNIKINVTNENVKLQLQKCAKNVADFALFGSTV